MDERPFQIVGCNGVWHHNRDVARGLRQRLKRQVVHIARLRQPMRPLPPPHGDRRVASPSSVDRADGEMIAIQIHLRSQHRGPAHVAGDRKIDRRTVDRGRIEPLERLLPSMDDVETQHLLLLRRHLHLRRGTCRLLSPEKLQLPPLLIKPLSFDLLPRNRRLPRCKRGGDVERVRHLPDRVLRALFRLMCLFPRTSRQHHRENRRLSSSVHTDYQSKVEAVRWFYFARGALD